MEVSAPMMYTSPTITLLPFTDEMLNVLSQRGNYDILFQTLQLLKDDPERLSETCRRSPILTEICNSPYFLIVGPGNVRMTLNQYVEKQLSLPTIAVTTPETVPHEILTCLIQFWGSYIQSVSGEYLGGGVLEYVEVSKSPYPYMERWRQRLGIPPGEYSRDAFQYFSPGQIPLNTDEPAKSAVTPVYVISHDEGRRRFGRFFQTIFRNPQESLQVKQELLNNLLVQTRQSYNQYIQSMHFAENYPDYPSLCFEMWLLDLFAVNWYLISTTDTSGEGIYVLAYSLQ
jgi:hypothetical protein